MRRKIEKMLEEWKNDTERMPLIIRGARQVGKSYIIEKFGKSSFDSLVVVNLEYQKNLQECFSSLDPKKIILQLEAILGKPIIPGKTLLFLDEIQESKEALKSLRYFKEKLPLLHVIAAGSLLEFSINDENFSFPVGRVQFLYLYPLSFIEFLDAMGQKKILEFLENVSIKNPPSFAIHQHLLNFVKDYFLIGGMPFVVKNYIKKKSFLYTMRVQESLLISYQNDFGKYAKKTKYEYLQKLFQRAPEMVGKHFKYSKIDLTAKNPAREYKSALQKLSNAGLINEIYASDCNGLPLRAERNMKKFKLIFLDIGLLQRALGIDYRIFTAKNIFQINSGVLSEQFVGQELLSQGDLYIKKQLFFWKREKLGSDAEIDYAFEILSHIIPIEVKAGKTGRLRSLQIFLKEKKIKIGIKISSQPLLLEKNILSIPFYLVHKIEDFLKELL